MAWLGFGVWCTICGCFFFALVTGRMSWALLSGWLVPVLCMALSMREGMVINGLMVLLCLVQFCLCQKGLTELRAWNTKQQKKHWVLYGLLYSISFLILFYCVAQAQIQGYMLNLQGWGSNNQNGARMLLTLIPMFVLNRYYTSILYTMADRLWCRKEELVLLETRCFIGKESTSEKVFPSYYLEGVRNGIPYHFRLTKRTYHMLKQETRLRLPIKRGLFGGLYLTDVSKEEWRQRVSRRDRREEKLAIFCIFVAIVSGAYLFWFRLFL